MIRVHAVRKAYGRTPVLEDVDLVLPAGGITALIGPNGAGKSTLLSIIGRLLPMDAGRVTVDGLDVATTPSAVLARRLAVLRQDNHIAARLTVRDLVAFGRYPHSQGRLTVVDRQRIAEAIAFLELDDLAGRYLDELSGGQRQRAFVAMVLAQETDYVLLDEPLNNLDLKHAVRMMQLLRRAARDLGRTIVVVLHDINFAAAYADHIVCLKAGRVAHQGTPADIFTAEILSAIYEVPVQVHDIAGQRFGLYHHLQSTR